MDIYVVLDGPVLVGASTGLQGAELLRTEWAQKLADQAALSEMTATGHEAKWTASYNVIYDRQQIVNTELRDT